MGGREQKGRGGRGWAGQLVHAADDVAEVVNGIGTLKRALAVDGDFSIQVDQLPLFPQKCVLLAVARRGSIRKAHDLAAVVDIQSLAVSPSQRTQRDQTQVRVP